MSRRSSNIGLDEIPTLKQAYEDGHFLPRTLKRSKNYAAKISTKYEHNEKFNEKLSLIQADITKLKIDAIVNAANETLMGGGGVDGAIHRAAGPGLRHECWDLNGCKTGDAKITKGYDLPAKHVIHTVGPIGEKPQLLQSAYKKSMQVMVDNGLKSIAFSNISTGVYGYPRVKAGKIALDTMRNWLEEHADLEKLDRIIFCVFEDENKEIYEVLFPIYFPPPDKLGNGETEEEEVRQEKSKAEEKDMGNGEEKENKKQDMTIITEQENVKENIKGGLQETKEKEVDKNKKQDDATMTEANEQENGKENEKETKKQLIGEKEAGGSSVSDVVMSVATEQEKDDGNTDKSSQQGEKGVESMDATTEKTTEQSEQQGGGEKEKKEDEDMVDATTEHTDDVIMADVNKNGVEQPEQETQETSPEKSAATDFESTPKTSNEKNEVTSKHENDREDSTVPVHEGGSSEKSNDDNTTINDKENPENDGKIQSIQPAESDDPKNATQASL